MIKEIFKLIVKVLESKLQKSGLEETILKNQNYFTEAKKIWNMVDENSRISKTIEEKIISKVDQFNDYVLTKFPELSQGDIDELRQSIAGEVNAGKEAIVNNSELLATLQAENTELKNKISQVQSTVTTVTEVQA